jgi:sodium/potassium-transporting ATPase subunit beta
MILFVFSAYRVPQKLPGGGRNQQICDFDQLPQEGKVCAVNVNKFHPCTTEMGYSYNKSSPCIFVKLNKVRIDLLIISHLYTQQ